MPSFSINDNAYQLLLDAVNRVEDTFTTLSQVDFSIPEVNTQVNPIRNTRISFTFNTFSGKSGIRWINYNRIHKSELPVLNVTRTTETTVYELLPLIRSLYNLPITEQDIEPDIITGNDLDITVDLIIKDTSLIFYDGPIITTTGTLPNYVKQPANIELEVFCVGTTKYGRYTDGYGGTYTKILEFYSTYCGFTGTTPPPPTTSIPPTTTTPPPTTTVNQTDVLHNGLTVVVNGEYVIY